MDCRYCFSCRFTGLKAHFQPYDEPCRRARSAQRAARSIRVAPVLPVPPYAGALILSALTARWAIGWNDPAVQRKDEQMTKQSKSPSHIAYVVRKIGEKSYFDRIGAAWANADGEGFTIRLNALPMSGEIVIRKPKADENGGAQ